MEKRYKVWADSESDFRVPYWLTPYFDDFDAAYDCATFLAHFYDGVAGRAIFHVEDLAHDETVETVESSNEL